MGWQVGTNGDGRDIGYGVPSECDYPGCNAPIDRGLAHVCGGMHDGGDEGCGLYFCGQHLSLFQFCDRCLSGKEPYTPKPDILEWIRWKMTDPSWQDWRDDNPEKVQEFQTLLKQDNA